MTNQSDKKRLKTVRTLVFQSVPSRINEFLHRWVGALALLTAILCVLAAIRSNSLANDATATSEENKVSICFSRGQSLTSNLYPYIVLRDGLYVPESEIEYHDRLISLRSTLLDARDRECEAHGQPVDFPIRLKQKLVAIKIALSHAEVVKRQKVKGVKPAEGPSPTTVTPDGRVITPPDNSGDDGEPNDGLSGPHKRPPAVTPPDDGSGGAGDGTPGGDGTGSDTPPLLTLPHLCVPAIPPLPEICIL